MLDFVHPLGEATKPMLRISPRGLTRYLTKKNAVESRITAFMDEITLKHALVVLTLEARHELLRMACHEPCRMVLGLRAPQRNFLCGFGRLRLSPHLNCVF